VVEPGPNQVARIIALNVKRAVWTRPELRAEIGYRGFRTASELRHALFKGLRGMNSSDARQGFPGQLA
jgi:ATP-dependent DNA ligase